MLHVRYHHTNCFFVRSNTSDRLLAIDAGWPATLYEYARKMKEIGCRLENVEWAMVTHFHMDHAGLIGEFLERGIDCFVFENQIDAVDPMERTIHKNYGDYRTIAQERLRRVTTRESTELLASFGIHGRVIVTDYHSPDSVSFIAATGEAVVGDLPPQGQMMSDDGPFQENWRRVWQAGGRSIYPAHAEPFELVDPT
jgi:ribonuclease/clavin/mitogillin